jgi:ribosomal protein L18
MISAILLISSVVAASVVTASGGYAKYSANWTFAAQLGALFGRESNAAAGPSPT